MLRGQEFAAALAEFPLALDLLIADEAHYMRNAGTRTYDIGEILTASADATAFLTATPLQLGQLDLFNLLHLLAPGEFPDRNLFQAQLAPNRRLTRATRHVLAHRPDLALMELEALAAGLATDHTGIDAYLLSSLPILARRYADSPYFREAMARLRGWQQARAKSEADDRTEMIAIERILRDLNALATIFTRTRKREVTHAAIRSPHSVVVTLSPQERAFYDGVVTHVRRELRRRGVAFPAFATVMYERMAASCLAAARESFIERVTTIDRSEFDLDADEQPLDHDFARSLASLAHTVGQSDSKYDQFSATLDQVFAETPTSKVPVFSFFRGTLSYLHRRLVQAGYQVAVMHGGIPVCERYAIIERFRTDPSLRLLLSSEVGAEGLDFQFCEVLINYDLPWNPMQIEQRIGRLDRFGQQAERIRIYSFFIEDSIETRIFQRLYQRIAIFEQSIGELEGILGEEIRTLSNAVFRSDLTPAEQEREAEEAARRLVRRQRELDDLEQVRDELLGNQDLLDAQVHDAIETGCFRYSGLAHFDRREWPTCDRVSRYHAA